MQALYLNMVELCELLFIPAIITIVAWRQYKKGKLANFLRLVGLCVLIDIGVTLTFWMMIAVLMPPSWDNWYLVVCSPYVAFGIVVLLTAYVKKHSKGWL